MKAYFSKITNGIYPDTVFLTFPDDVVEIPADIYEKFKTGEISQLDILNGEVINKGQVAYSIEDQRNNMSCYVWQFRRALTQLGLRSELETQIANQPDLDIIDMWEYETSYNRQSTLISAISTLLNKTDVEIDEIFVLAKSLTS
jgi:hypothetical protein